MGRVFVRDQDVLRIVSIASTAAALTIHADVKTERGRIIPINFAQSANTDRTALGTDTPAIGVTGEIVGASIAVRTAGVKRGQCYATLNVRGGETYTGICKGYVYEGHQVDLGQFVEPGPGGGEGFIRTVTGANPAANTEVSETVPTNALWRLRFFSVVLAQGLTQTPRPYLVIDDGTTANRKYISGQSTTTQAASTNRTWIWPMGATLAENATYLAAVVDTDTINEGGRLPTEGILLEEGDRIRTATSGIGANTDYASPIFEVEEWLVL